MKLKSGMVLRDVGDQHMVIPIGEINQDFHGLIRNNDTANFIYQKLQSDTTEEEILQAMLKEYDGTAEEMRSGIEKVIEELRKMNILDE